MPTPNPNLQSLLFFDVVTVRETPDFNSLPAEVRKTLANRFQPSNAPTTNTLEGFFGAKTADIQQVYNDQGMFYPEVSKIIAITTGMFVPGPESTLVTKIHTISNLTEEASVIKNFYSLVERMKAKRVEEGQAPLSLATFNGKRFDVPFVSKRSLINGIEIPAWIQTQGIKPWEHPVLDIMECWDFGGRYDYTSLPNMAYAFGIRDLKYKAYHDADNLYHTTPTSALPEVTDIILEGSYNEVLATMRLATKLIGKG